MSQQLRSITVGELRELLEGEDDHALVIFSCDYGDYHHTPQALPLRGEAEEVKVVESAYSHSGFAILEDDDEDDEDEIESETYLVIR